jgi:hypothetical protein
LADSTAGMGIFDAFAQLDRSFKPEMPFSDFFVQAGSFYYMGDSCIVIQQGILSTQKVIKFSHKMEKKSGKWLGIRKLFLRKPDGVEVWAY